MKASVTVTLNSALRVRQKLGFSPSTLEIIANEADEDSAAYGTGSQEMRGLLICHLCDFV